MKQRLLDAAKIICATSALVFATSAMAEPLRMAQAQPGVLPPHEIITILRSTGIDPLDRPVRRGPTYVLRATDEGGEEVRVVVDARGGEVLSVTPLATASRGPLPGGTHMGPYEPMEPGYIPPNYAPPGPPGVYGAGPPVDYESDEPMIYGTRPPAPIPGARQRAQGAPPPGGAPNMAAVPPGEPHVIMAPDNGETGMLPPPPERFPQRAAPPVTKKPVKRAASATPPKSVAAKPVKPKVAPLPKPRPGAVTSAPAPAATAPAATAPAATPPQNKPAVDAMPN